MNEFRWIPNIHKDEHHVYWVDGKHRVPRSVTGCVSSLFRPFDKARVLARYPADERAAVEAGWEATRQAGDDAHADIERALLAGEPIDTILDGIVLCILDELPWAVEIIGTEVPLYSHDYGIAGTADCIARVRETGALIIIDWKRIDKDIGSGARVFGTSLDGMIPDSKYHRHSLQLWLYAIMLTDLIGDTCRIAALYTGNIHPATEDDERLVQAFDYRVLARDIIGTPIV